MTVKEFAENLNLLRIIPRILVLAATVYVGVVSWDLIQWYMLLEIRTVEESGFVFGTIGALTTILKFMIDTYIRSGNTE